MTTKDRRDHPRCCTAHKHNGDPCRRYAAKGTNVCRLHGGAAPQVMAKAKRRMSEANDRAVVRAIRERIRGNYAEGPDLALAPVDLADDLATYPAEPSAPQPQPATPAPPDTAENPAETAAHSPADGPVDPPTADGPETAPASPSGPSTPVPPGTGLMSLEEAVSRTRPNQAFARGGIPAARRGRRR